MNLWRYPKKSILSSRRPALRTSCCTKSNIRSVFLGHDVSTSTGISTSIAVHPEDGADAKTLLKHADLAMYRAQSAGSGTFRFFDPEMNVKTIDRHLNEPGLRRVIARNELTVHYQPRVDVSSGATVGIKALVRRIHPGCGILGAIGKWVLRVVCRPNRAWQNAGLPQTKISINLSAHRLLSPLFADTLGSTVDKRGLDMKWIELEITETSLMQNIEASLETLRKIQAMGMSIDDLGTGYSSLSYLEKLPIDTQKINHPVVICSTNLMMQSSWQPLSPLHTTWVCMSLRKAWQLPSKRFLIEKDCTTMQGYLFSQPLPATQCEAFLHKTNAPLQHRAFGVAG